MTGLRESLTRADLKKIIDFRNLVPGMEIRWSYDSEDRANPKDEGVAIRVEPILLGLPLPL